MVKLNLDLEGRIRTNSDVTVTMHVTSHALSLYQLGIMGPYLSSLFFDKSVHER